MTTILDNIVADKKIELEGFPSKIAKESNREPHSFLKTLEANSQSIALIGEVKRASPSAGEINIDVDPVKQATAYQKAGADAISVLTDKKHFKGTMDDLKAIREKVSLPILNKNFIIDERQIYQAYNAGADIILLIVAILDDDQLKEFYDLTTNLGMDAIVEVHDESEMPRALAINPKIIGINNRNLKEFTVDIAHSEDLLEKYKQDGIRFISESGIHSAEDAKRMKQAGADGFLVGEMLMKAENPAQAVTAIKQG